MKKYFVFLALAASVLLSGCGSDSKETPPGKIEKSEVEPKAEEPAIDSKLLANKGIGPVTSVQFAALDSAMAKEGEKIYGTYCIACHKVEEDFLGPSPKGIFKRRSPEWVMNMILNTDQMNREDSIAKELLKNSNGAVMVNMGLKEEQARAILEFFRTID